MKKFIVGFLLWVMLITPMFSGLNKHGYDIYNDWIWAGYNNEGSWQIVDLSDFTGNKQALIRILLEVTDYADDPLDYAAVYIREHDASTDYKACATSYSECIAGSKGEIECWTDDDGFIDMKLEQGAPEYKKVKIKVTLENSIN